jgi:hypothetical protein
MQGLMNITKNQVPKLLSHAARATTATTAPLLTSVASRNYAGSVQKQNKVGEGASHAFEPVNTNADKLSDVWRPAENQNPLKELESGDLNLSDSGVLGISVDMDALKETKEATEHWKEETKEYSEESAKQAANLGTGFAHTASGFTTTSLKDSAAEMIAPYAAATSSIGTLAAEKIGELEEKLGWVQKKASEDTRRQEQKISNAADYVTEKVAEVKETIVKSTPDWTSDAKHKAEEAAKHTHLKDYAAKAGEIMKEKAAEVYEKVAGTVHRAKESIAVDSTTTERKIETKDGEHYVSTEQDLHVDQEMGDEWSPEKPHDFELPKRKEIS